MTPEESAKAALAAKRANATSKATAIDEHNQVLQRLNVRYKLLCIQNKMRVLKNRGKGHNPNAQVTYEYRNAEDILEVAKPLCTDVGAIVTVDVLPVLIGESLPTEIREVKAAGQDRYGNPIAATFARVSAPHFVALATATFTDCESGESISCRSFAEIDFWRKGQTEPEKLCGSADSYASKYALGHLFALDNNRDADMESDGNAAQRTPPPPDPGF